MRSSIHWVTPPVYIMIDIYHDIYTSRHVGFYITADQRMKERIQCSIGKSCGLGFLYRPVRSISRTRYKESKGEMARKEHDAPLPLLGYALLSLLTRASLSGYDMAREMSKPQAFFFGQGH